MNHIFNTVVYKLSPTKNFPLSKFSMRGLYVFADAHYNITFVITKQSVTHQQMINSITNSLNEFLSISKAGSIIDMIMMHKQSNVSLSQHYTHDVCSLDYTAFVVSGKIGIP